jgi:hypothetical protein
LLNDCGDRWESHPAGQRWQSDFAESGYKSLYRTQPLVRLPPPLEFVLQAALSPYLPQESVVPLLDREMPSLKRKVQYDNSKSFRSQADDRAHH